MPESASGASVLNKDELEAVKASLEELARNNATVATLQQTVDRLSDDLAEERKERYSALADVNHLTEVVAKAAAATIERAERRFADELGAERERLKSFSK